MRPADLLNRLADRPFSPLRIHLSDGTTLEVPEPSMVIVGKSTAVLPSAFDRDEEGHRIALHWRTISLLHIVQFSDMENGGDGNPPQGSDES